ncbi:MAG: nitroreductase [Gemmobacter sp.]
MTRSPALEFLLARRSRPAKLLRAPVPDAAALRLMLTAAARVPDHGKLEPWRFVVLERAALARLAEAAGARAAAAGLAPDLVAKARSQFDASPLAVVVVASPKPSDKIPEIEQVLSVGAACLSLLNAALASGWGANWLTGWAAHDRGFVEGDLGLAAQEWVAGIVHIGTATEAVPDRPRPDMDRIVTWVMA